MDINVFLLCFNESVLLPYTVKHYKKYLPSCKITIYDNESTDNSVEIAKELGCSIISWSSNDMIDDFKYKEIKNNCWKSIKKGWVIMADMDEFLCVSEDDLMKEMNLGTTILNVKGCDMLGESKTFDLSDIDLQNIKKYIDNHYENKKLCFLRENITEMNYECGAHCCNPQGYNDIKYSSNMYINKHMSFLGLIFFTNKYIERYKRAANMRKHGMAVHYTQDIVAIENIYRNNFNSCKLLD
jgi:hypothetical protein